jgi:trk system potassium uptake protein TrkH
MMDSQGEQGGVRPGTVVRAFEVARPIVAGVAAGALVVVLLTGWGLRHLALFAWVDVLVLLYFVADVGVRLWFAEGRWAHVKARWLDAIVVAPLIQVPMGLGTGAAWFVVHQAATLGAAFTRTRPVARLASQLWLRPARMMVSSFAGAILVGTLLLHTPWASPGEEPLGAVDSLFTATSAVCVTGLVVKNTGRDFTLFGQLVILVLIQLGGLGIMTFSVSMVLALGRGLSKPRAVVMQDMLDQESVEEVLGLVRFVAKTTLLIEAVGAMALFAVFSAHGGPGMATVPERVLQAVFHSVSAFCNAGFSLFTRSLEGYRADVWTNLVFAGLIIVGGLGFPVLRDLRALGRRRRLGEGRPAPLRAQTKVVLLTSALLILVGAAVFYVADANHTLAAQRPGTRVLASLFQSVTARTAGFNTVDLAAASHAALLLLMLLMFVGASPGSTGGGVKTTTVAVVWSSMWAALRGRPQVEMFRRTVPLGVVRRALALVALSVVLLAAMGVALMAAEARATAAEAAAVRELDEQASAADGPHAAALKAKAQAERERAAEAAEARSFRGLAFEVVSAFGTVGLSAGVTRHLSAAGRLIITALMFIGRLGPLTLAFLLVGEMRPAAYEYPEERLMVG